MYEATIKFRNLRDFSIITIHLVLAGGSLTDARSEAVFRSSNQLNSYFEYNIIHLDVKQVYTVIK